MTELLGAVPPLGNATAHFPTIVHPRQPSRIWADATAPLPTNEWWQDLVLEESGANAVTTLPFIVRARADGLHVGLPDDGRRTVAERYVIADLAEDWSFGAAEGLGPRRVRHSYQTDHAAAPRDEDRGRAEPAPGRALR